VAKYEGLDLLHAHYAIPHATIGYLAREILKTHGKYLPLITTLHGTDITLVGTNRAFSPVVEFSINQSDGVTAVSESLKNDTYANFDIKKDISVIYNFIDFDRFKRSNKDHFRKAIAPNGEKIIVHTSNFRKVKRVEDVVLVFKKIHEKIPSKLLLIGDGPERINLEAMCRQLGICDDVRFLGKQEAIEEILAVADLFLIPSGSESFGLAALEAMACEVPVISSDIGGLPEVNIHGTTGFMSPVGDVESMANYALKLLLDDEMLAAFRKNALSQAKRFDIHNILPEYEQLYERVLEESKSKVLLT
jgi:N-acetyl-alpha-D-glucosaminyl L-malate synthase BshA